jgi:hypothetical protein
MALNVTPGTHFEVEYFVTDSNGLSTTSVQSAIVVDDEEPAILLSAGQQVEVPFGTVYREKGWSTLDNFDGDLTPNTTVEGQVDVMIPGTYRITYNATDTYGNAVQVVRRVQVLDERFPSSDTSILLLAGEQLDFESLLPGLRQAYAGFWFQQAGDEELQQLSVACRDNETLEWVEASTLLPLVKLQLDDQGVVTSLATAKASTSNSQMGMVAGVVVGLLVLAAVLLLARRRGRAQNNGIIFNDTKTHSNPAYQLHALSTSLNTMPLPDEADSPDFGEPISPDHKALESASTSITVVDGPGNIYSSVDAPTASPGLQGQVEDTIGYGFDVDFGTALLVPEAGCDDIYAVIDGPGQASSSIYAAVDATAASDDYLAPGVGLVQAGSAVSTYTALKGTHDTYQPRQTPSHPEAAVGPSQVYTVLKDGHETYRRAQPPVPADQATGLPSNVPITSTHTYTVLKEGHSQYQPRSKALAETAPILLPRATTQAPAPVLPRPRTSTAWQQPSAPGVAVVTNEPFYGLHDEAANSQLASAEMPVLAVNRVEAEALLQPYLDIHGAFLLRKRADGSVALSVVLKRATFHFVAQKNPHGQGYLVNEHLLANCASIQDVVKHLKTTLEPKTQISSLLSYHVSDSAA